MNKRGRITQSTGKWYKVSSDGETINCRLPGKFRLDKKEVTNPIAVGDYVTFEIGNDGTGSILSIEERKNYIPRQATHGRRGEQTLAANIDRAWVVQSVREPKINLGFIDRFLVTCEAYEVAAGIIFNKIDLAKGNDLEFVEDVCELYESLGYKTVITSIKNSEMMDALKKEVNEITSVFIGPSGAGKTSILNQIAPGFDLRVGEISSYSQKGKHTTTYAQLVPLSEGGFIVDTPGIRELGLVQIEKSELSLYFPEMIEPRQYCKFNNCTHFHEPGCGVVQAYEMNKIDPDRYNSYINMLESLN
jgi:ribosome biogenesis GTPase / thiamine phosphate phosphatase